MYNRVKTHHRIALINTRSKWTVFLALLFAACSGECTNARAEEGGLNAAADDSGLLTRVRQVRQLVSSTGIAKERLREASMVLAWGQLLEHMGECEDPEHMAVVKEYVESPSFVRKMLTDALADFETEGDSFAARRGMFLSAYISNLDSSGQFYALFVPQSYDPHKLHALEVRPAAYLHHSADPFPEFTSEHIVLFCDSRGIEGLGELDVLEMIRDVRSHYAIDPDRIYLLGGSIGGGGVWRMAARYPDLFAAALVDNGWTWTSVLYLENVSNIPMWLYHDTTDVWVPVDESRTAVKFLQAMASPIVYSETTGGGHSPRLKDPAWKQEEWLLSQRRNPYPKRVYYTTATPTRGRAYWLNIREFTDPNDLAMVRAFMSVEASQNQLFLSMANVDVLQIDLPTELCPSEAPLKIVAGGAPLHVRSPLPDSVYLRRTEDGVYGVTTEDPREPKPFRPYTAGGLACMYTSGEPLMIVRGTGGDNQELVEAIQGFCNSLSVRNIGWWVFPMGPDATGRIPVKTDTEVTQRDIQRCNLILVGPVSANQVLANITHRLPAVEDEGSLHVGPENYELDGRGYGLFHYNPDAPQRLIMVMSSPELDFYKSVLNGIATRMGDERPLGLVLIDANSRRKIRQVMWDKDWQVCTEAFADEHLPSVFGKDVASCTELHHLAMRKAAGTEYTVFWQGNLSIQEQEYMWALGSARWHDLRADVGQARTVLKGWATGADLADLLKLVTNVDGRVGVSPPIDETSVLPEADYRIAMDPILAKWFVQATGHPVRGANAIRVNLFEETRRVWCRE
ncbi:MAG TPA: hypothetical protein HPP83_01160 [Candidatus Hydrogenedentes bacterium]|nr:hypothetical protein [Candidatus Hydrogenedentota bacterium]